MKKEFNTIDKFLEGHALAEKMTEQIKNKSPEIFDEELLHFIEENKEQILSRMQECEKADRVYAKVKKKDQQADLRRFENKLRTNARKRNTMRIVLSSSVAALLIFSFTIVYNVGNKPKSYTISHCTDNATITIPTLITENGTAIVIDSDEIALENIDKINCNKLRYRKDTTGITHRNQMIVPAGHTFNLQLEDGSEVTLNAGATLTYPTAFVGNAREVELTGEAYFKVAKSDKPFIVTSEEQRIIVYGTEFNVRCLKGKMTETLLVEGSIGVVFKDGTEVLMSPNDYLTYNCVTNEYCVAVVEPEDYCMWRNNMFRFKDQTLENVLHDLSSWYNVEFTSSIEMDDIVVTMALSRNEPLNEIIPFLEKLTKLKIINQGKGVYELIRE